MIKSGKIKALSTRGGVAKATGKPFTINLVVLEDGTEVEVGFKQPYTVGEHFSRSVETKFGKLADAGPARAGDVEMAATPSAQPSAPSSGGAGSYSARTFPVGRDSPEMSIIRQNALTNAREVVMNSYRADLNGMGTKAERQQHLDAVAEDIMYLAYKFADFSSGQREVKQVMEMARLNPPMA